MKVRSMFRVSAVLLYMLVMAIQPVRAQFQFSTNSDGTLSVTNFTGSGAVIIPDSTNGMMISSIAAHAFQSNNSITSVVFPAGITNIGTDAFFHCLNLTSITVPEGLITFGFASFDETGLTNLTIPSTVTTIGTSAFTAAKLTNVFIPAQLTNISPGAFVMQSLLAITVDTNNPTYISEGGILFTRDITTLVEYPGGLTGSYVVPNTVTNINSQAFGASDLSKVVIPDNVTTIGQEAFLGAGALTNLIIGNSVTNIGSMAFDGCINLRKII